MPTAESIAYKQINLGIDYSLTSSREGDEGADKENHLYYKFNLGSFENWGTWHSWRVFS